MIIDRTQYDVDEAKRIRIEKVQSFVELTDEEIEILERGTITVNTLNRIEDKQKELKDLFFHAGYYNTDMINKTWNYTDIFSSVEFNRLIDNLNVLRNAFFVYSDTPPTPNTAYHYKDINSLERILVDLENMLMDMKSRCRQCGTFMCGEVN